jgi:predicted acylesterase/phospholipase RssA
MVTLDTPTADSARADAVLADEVSLTAKAVVQLARAVASLGDRDRARRLHAKRLQMDQERAYLILSGAAAEPSEQLELAVRLAGDKELGLARRLMKTARSAVKPSDPVFLKVYQKSTLYTYKDPDLPLDWRLDRAFEILQDAGDLATTTSAESLGLAGAIFKRKWEVDSDRQQLERALFFYLRGYALGAPEAERANVLAYLERNPGCVMDPTRDQGWTGLNAAFVLDLVADQEEAGAARAGMGSPAAALRRRSAQLIREEIIRSVPGLVDNPAFDWIKREWWFYATVGEAHFGLGHLDAAHYDAAVDWLVTRPAAAGLERSPADLWPGPLDIPEWEFESTARQLARVALLHAPADMTEADFEALPAGRTLSTILANDGRAVRSAFRGKFGLALSGGGFRASLFHIGVLACLAERDVLRHVEVLSCVSGGSIIGAHYYLELRRLLQSKVDSAITPSDYVEIVQRIQQEFLRGVQRNLRMRVLAEFTTNLKMMFVAGYTRTKRLGDLYERELFSRVPDGHRQGSALLPDWLAELLGQRRHRWLNEQFIAPMTAGGQLHRGFTPRNHNWRRENKVPALVLNATSLNTGHCWQFTASFMGEPPTPINADIDANERLRRMWYRDAPPPHRKVRLGHAVAASSCVPGLFEPLVLDHLYPDRNVKLVDGGVCDNQGIASLLEQDCSVTLVSDASGQMDSQPVPSSGALGVPLRANTILQARVRETQYTGAAARRRSGLLRGLMFLHLKQDLPADQIAWLDIPSHLKVSDFASVRDARQDVTTFGVETGTQRRLSAIRTDLDSFHDVEAFALMASGYKMADAQLSGRAPAVAGFSQKRIETRWTFLDVEPAMSPAAVKAGPEFDRQRRNLARLLDVAASAAFKVWRLSTPLAILLCLLVAAAAAWLIRLFATRWSEAVLPPGVAGLTFRQVAMFALTAAGAALLAVVVKRLFGERYGRGILKAIHWRDTLRSIVIGLCMAGGGFIVARVHLHLFDRLYLRLGKLDRL